ncbi:MAG: cytochrome bd-I oxidase subunit CydX [Neisseriaceae bacterium]|nr:cytochrome bd-I oxidase subunit CydX [Neisseriaceae bacterium]
MWYFTWILGLGLAISIGIIGVLWLENKLSGQDAAAD